MKNKNFLPEKRKMISIYLYQGGKTFFSENARKMSSSTAPIVDDVIDSLFLSLSLLLMTQPAKLSHITAIVNSNESGSSTLPSSHPLHSHVLHSTAHVYF
jgi:hypothetical protein